MSTEKYTAKQAKTATKIIKYFAKFQARIFFLAKVSYGINGLAVFLLWLLEPKARRLIKLETFH